MCEDVWGMMSSTCLFRNNQHNESHVLVGRYKWGFGRWIEITDLRESASSLELSPLSLVCTIIMQWCNSQQAWSKAQSCPWPHLRCWTLPNNSRALAQYSGAHCGQSSVLSESLVSLALNLLGRIAQEDTPNSWALPYSQGWFTLLSFPFPTS